MIYQLTAYYGASVGDKVIYSAVMSFDDCTKFSTEPIDCEPVKNCIIDNIIKDGFNPNDFTFSWLTKEKYENKIESKTVQVIKINE
jgi:hypothetical protein